MVSIIGVLLLSVGLLLGSDYSGWPDGDDLHVDEQVILFLMPDPYEPGHDRTVRSQWSAFRVEGDNVLALTADIAARRSEQPRIQGRVLVN